MPELPEVETVRRSLQELVLNKTIESIEVRYPRIIQTDLEDFKNSLLNQSITDILRVGKYLIFKFNDYLLVSHLRMEGKYFLKSKSEELSLHDHIIFNFTDDTKLVYNDTRKFGTMSLFLSSDINEIRFVPPLDKVGYEPFDPLMTVDYLYSKLSRSKKPIKTALLDQSIMCGLGNIYVDEVCFLTHIHPQTISSSLDKETIAAIIENSKVVLQKAITLGGTTIKSFVNSHAATGLFQNELLVHTKTTCPVCSAPITKIRVGGRGTYFCNNCQHLIDKTNKT